MAYTVIGQAQAMKQYTSHKLMAQCPFENVKSSTAPKISFFQD
jgi:hypothetical protein